jgi:hypothetical protein
VDMVFLDVLSAIRRAPGWTCRSSIARPTGTSGLRLRPDDLLTILMMALSIDLRDSVSLFPSIQATRF